MNNQKEVWLPVKGCDGVYEVSNLGRVKSLKYNKERVLKGGVNSAGYVNVILFVDGVKIFYNVHQLVAITFLGHNPNRHKLVVDHIDNDRLNNNLENLQLISHRENSSKDSIGKTSIYTGVSWNKRYEKWGAYCQHNNKNINLGGFDCELAAAKAYNDKLKEINKEL
jgi:hypothetical protein